jgi:hypothetical protein
MSACKIVALFVLRNGTGTQLITTRKKNTDSCVLAIEFHHKVTVGTE